MGPKMCKATGFLLTFFGIASIYNLTAIALFRYLVMEWSNASVSLSINWSKLVKVIFILLDRQILQSTAEKLLCF